MISRGRAERDTCYPVLAREAESGAASVARPRPNLLFCLQRRNSAIAKRISRCNVLRSWASLFVLALFIAGGALLGDANAQTPTIGYVYDSVGRLVAVYDASGNAAVYNYDLVGNLLSIVN
jgi:YD repeat-containing protein